MQSTRELRSPLDPRRFPEIGSGRVLSPRTASIFGAIAVSTALLGFGYRSMPDNPTGNVGDNPSARDVGVYSVGSEDQGSRVEVIGRSYSDTLYVGSYGLLGSKVGTLGVYTSTADLFHHTGVWGEWVQQQFPDKHVVKVLFPVLNSQNRGRVNELVTEAANRKGENQDWLVMPTIEKGGEQELMGIISDMLVANSGNANIGFMLDLEHFGRKVSASELNRLIAFFGDKRAAMGLKEPGLIGAWFFRDKDFDADEIVVSEHVDADGNVLARFVPIFDGFGSAEEKWVSYQKMMSTFGSNSGGMMDFTWRWGNGRYDTNTTSELFEPTRIPTNTLKFLVQQ